jgi:hypothetical protein
VDLAAVAAGAAAAAGAASSSWLQRSQVQLVVVLDTNVLLESKLVRALQRLQQMQQQQGGGIIVQLPQQQQQGVPGGSGSNSRWDMGLTNGQPAAAAVCVQVVIPWTVLVELDRLKLRECAACAACLDRCGFRPACAGCAACLDSSNVYVFFYWLLSDLDASCWVSFSSWLHHT